MNAEEISELKILVNKLKFKAGQKANNLHDLIEDRLMTDFEDIPWFAITPYEACKEWSTKNKELQKVKQKPENSGTESLFSKTIGIWLIFESANKSFLKYDCYRFA